MNLKIFKRRLIRFYSSWKNKKKDLWGNSDILVLCTPPSPETSPNPISSAFFVWLLGHDLPDTIAVFTKDEIYFLCTKKRFLMFQNLEDAALLAVQARVRVILKQKNETGWEKLDDILHGIRDTQKQWAADADEIAPLVVGYIFNESPRSKLLWCCANNLKKNEFLGACVPGFSQLLNLHGNSSSAAHIQMLNIPHEVEQMLLMEAENEEGKPSEARDKALRLDKTRADLSSTTTYNMVETASYAKGIARISSEHNLVHEEEDEWVLVEG